MSESRTDAADGQLLIEPEVCPSFSVPFLFESEDLSNHEMFFVPSNDAVQLQNCGIDSMEAVCNTSELLSSVVSQSSASSQLSYAINQSHLLPPDGLEADDLGSLLQQFEEVEVIMGQTLEEPSTSVDVECCADADIRSHLGLLDGLQTKSIVSLGNDPLIEECSAFSVELPLNVHNHTSLSDSCTSTTRRSQLVSDLRFEETHNRTSQRGSFDYKRFSKSKARKRRTKTIETSDQVQLFDKLPNYYTALSIPARALAGSTAHSSADLVAEFIEHRERNQSPEREDLHLLDKIPAYQSSFTNSTRYDADSVIGREMYEEDFQTVEYSNEEFEKDIRSNWSTLSSSDSECSSMNDDVIEEKPSETHHVKRRIVYIGRLPKSFTSSELRAKFGQFGEIKACSVHIREHGDCYGFVTYVRPEDAALAVDSGNTIDGCETLDICFGGRRQFCKSDYADLDGKTVVREEFLPFCNARSSETVDFDELLFMAKQQQRSNR